MPNEGFWDYNMPHTPDNLNASLPQRGDGAPTLAAGQEGRIYVDNLSDTVHIDNGSAWDVLIYGMPPGTMLEYGGVSAPPGYLLCNGAAVSRTTYARLFATIGTRFGAGNRSTTFNLPDYRRRVAVGAGGTGTAELGSSVGNRGGDETHTLSTSEMPSHTHSGISHNHSGGSGLGSVAVSDSTNSQTGSTGGFTTATQGNQSSRSFGVSVGSTGFRTASVGDAGSGSAHNNMQPSLVVTKIIKT